MIIRKVTIENWRAIRASEYSLEPGVNILKGPNETGKSSTVEAIEWALYRDIVGGARARDEIRPILPAHDPLARPMVTLELEFSDCTAIICKTLADDSAHRVCRLVVRQPGVSDQTFEQAEAQAKLKALMNADGVGQERGNSLEAALLISRQGQAAGYIESEISTAVRSTLTIGADGSIAPTSRLERVRKEVDKRRTKELFERLKQQAADAAKKQSEAARLREELDELREQRQKYFTIEDSIEDLRATIARLLSQIEEVRPREVVARERVEELRQRQSAQLKVNFEVSELRAEHVRATVARDELQKQVDEITQQRAVQVRAEHDLETAQTGIGTAQQAQDAAQARYDAADKARAEVEARVTDTRQRREAWERFREVSIAKKELRKARKSLEELEVLEQEIAKRRAELNALPARAQRKQIYAWQQQFASLEQLRREAAQQLQVSIALESALGVLWRVDEGETQQAEAGAGEMLEFSGGQSVVITLPGVGEIRVGGAGKETRKLAQEIESRVRTLDSQLSPLGLSAEQLPDGFAQLEAACSAGEAAEQSLQTAEHRLQQTVSSESIADVRAHVNECETAWREACEACEPLRRYLPADITAELAATELLRSRAAEAEVARDVERAQQEWNNAFKQLSEQKAQVAVLTAQIRTAEEARRQSTQRLQSLLADGLDDATRNDNLEHLAAAVLQARLVRDSAITRQAELGEEITEHDIHSAQREAGTLASALQSLENELLQRRSDLRHQCEQDPRTEMDRLDYEIELRETELSRHEARLRGIAILEAALEAERHRLGRALAEPLNQHLSPWLSAIRGKETHVEFDDNGKRITKIRTRDGESTISLDFASHSGGMQEQTALAMRLLVARLAARRLPSGRLPVVLDDPLTQSDTMRRTGLRDVLIEAAENLQIIFVTCHPEHSRALSEANEISLGDLPEATVPTDQSTPVPVEAPVEPVAPASKTRRKTAKVKAETNGHVKPESEAVGADTLSLF